MNRKTFLASLASVAALPSILENSKKEPSTKKIKECQDKSGKIVGIYLIHKKHFEQMRKQGAIDFITSERNDS